MVFGLGRVEELNVGMRSKTKQKRYLVGDEKYHKYPTNNKDATKSINKKYLRILSDVFNF